jgi:hypothetical protein
LTTNNGRNFCLPFRNQTVYWAHPASCPMHQGTFSSEILKLTIRLSLVPNTSSFISTLSHMCLLRGRSSQGKTYLYFMVYNKYICIRHITHSTIICSYRT